MDVDALRDAIRQACGPARWSRGVELARDGSVRILERLQDGIVVRVQTRGGLAIPDVTIFPGDLEWACACDAEACEHAAAAVIALTNESVDVTPAGTLAYRLTRAHGVLTLSRVVVDTLGEHEIRAPLDALERGRVDAPPFAAMPADRGLEAALGAPPRGEPIPRERAPRVLRALARCNDVRLDGAPVEIALEPVLPVARIARRGTGHVLRIESPPALETSFANGLALAGGALRPIGDPRLTARERERWPRGEVFPPERLAELVGTVLPGLRDRLPVVIEDERLTGEMVDVPPRLVADFSAEDDRIGVRLAIGYGDPLLARVQDGVLRHLGGAVPRRDTKAEAELEALARQRFALPVERLRFVGVEQAAVLADELARTGIAVTGDARRLVEIAAPLAMNATFDGERLDVGFETKGPGGGTRRASARAVAEAFLGGRTLVPLEGGGFAPLPLLWWQEHGHRVLDLLAARDAQGRLGRAARLELARFVQDAALEGLDGAADDALAALAAPDATGRAEALDADEAALPDVLRSALRPYQREGVRWLLRRRAARVGALLADDMGLGKTVQAAAVLEGRTLVVAPASVMIQWRDELARFRPDLRVAIYHGPARRLQEGPGVTLTTYGILRADVDALSGIVWDVLVLDEAHSIKTPEGQTARAARALAAHARFALTGTPVENRLEELWSQMQVLNPGLLGSLADFRARVARPAESGDAPALARLRDRLAPFLLRRLKRDVAQDLPPRTETVLYATLDEKERALYDTVRAAARADLVSRLDGGAEALHVLEALLRLRQAACHPALLPGHAAETSSKLEVLVERLEEAAEDGHRALVFSQWTSLLDLVERRLDGAGLERVRLDGSTRDRAAVVARFQDDPQGPPVMLVSLKAGGVGLNLTAADHVFLLDPWWNPAAEDQAADRAHRIGQTRPVNVYKLVAADTVEERVLALAARKRDLASLTLTRAEIEGLLD